MEPSSPPTILHSSFSGVDIKVEQSSPPPRATDSLTVYIKGPFELPVLLPKIVSVTSLSSSSDTSSGKDSLVSNNGVSVGPTGSSQKESGSNESTHSVCEVCWCYFLNEDKARRHRLRHEGKKSYFCFVCGRGFHYLNRMRQHEQTHGCVKAHTCLVCDQKFVEECELVEHQIMHMSAEMYTCRMCESKFCTREALDRHEQMHASGADMCVCGECGMTFEQMAALERHLKLHVTEMPHRCHLCPARFSAQRSLEKHVVMHVATKREKCPVCLKTYCGYKNLMSHIRVKHCRVHTTMANGNNSGKVLRDPPTTSPPENASVSEKGPAGAACRESTSAMHPQVAPETSVGIVDSKPRINSLVH